MNKKNLLIVIGLILAIGAGYWLYQATEKQSQESLDSADERRQACIEIYGTPDDPLGLSDDADPRLAECLNQVDPQNPLGI